MVYSQQELDCIQDQSRADYMDALADLAYEQDQAMRESQQSDWDGIDDISDAERNACDHFNERNTYTLSD